MLRHTCFDECVTALEQWRRRASVYLMVLGTAVIVTILGVSALTLLRIERRAAQDTTDSAAARGYARSALEMAFLVIRSDVNWRQNWPAHAWDNQRPIGTGTFSIQAIDPVDGDLANNDDDPVVLTGRGYAGPASYKLSVRMVPEGAPGLDCLQTALHSAGLIDFSSATVQCDQKMSSDLEIQASSADVYGDVEAVGAVNGGTFHGSRTSGIDPRGAPPDSVFQTYQTQGTAIALGTIPSRIIEKIVLSPASNPYGPSLNANGIYYIQCGGQDIVIRNCRIVATLVLIAPAGGSKIEGSVCWEPAISNYPALLVENGGNQMYFQFGNSTLSESALSVNFNPTGTPYQDGDPPEDTDLVDTYPSKMKGIVYVSDYAETYNHPVFEGVVIIGDGGTWIQNSLDLTYSSNYLNNPPPGFERLNRPMVVDSGSWHQVVD